MKALTLTQPWATLVAIGAKRYETRSWSTTYRGEIAIHAAKGITSIGGKEGFYDLCMSTPFKDTLCKCPSLLAAAKLNALSTGSLIVTPKHVFDSLPMGAIVAVARLGEIYSTNALFSVDSLPETGSNEEEFGDYSANRFAWELLDVRPLKAAVPCKGALSIWDVPADVEAKVRAQL